MSTRQVLLGACLVLLHFQGCAQKDFSESIDSSFAKVEQDQFTFRVSETREAQWLTWSQAVKLLRERNLTYLRAKEQLREIQKERDALPLRLLDPRLRVVTSLGSALGDLSSLDSNSYGVRLLGTINIPSPATYYARRYGLELQYYNSQLDLELLERRLLISLYGTFLRQRQLEVERSSMTNNEIGGDVDQQIKRLISGEQTEQNLRREAERIRLDLNRSLDTPGLHWVCKVSTMPQISYVGRLDELDPRKGYGRLALKQAAGQVEAGLLRVRQVKLRKWPTFNTGVSLPSFYNSQTDEDFDLGESNLFTSFGKNFEFSGADARSLDSANARAKFVERSLRQRLERESSRLRDLKANFRQLLTQRDQLLRTRAWLAANVPSGGSDQLLTHLESIESNDEELRRNESSLRLLDMQFWVWDERYWKKK